MLVCLLYAQLCTTIKELWCIVVHVMASFKNIAWENGADVTVELTIEDLSEGDSVMLFEDREFEQRTVAGFKDGILDQLIVLEDGREVDQHKLSDGDGSRQGGDLYALANKDLEDDQ